MLLTGMRSRKKSAANSVLRVLVASFARTVPAASVKKAVRKREFAELDRML